MALVGAWTVIAVDILRSGVRLPDLWRNRNFILMAATGALLASPYAFSSGLRIYVPATLFLYLALGALARPRRLVVIAQCVITGMHGVGVLLNYPASQTDCFELDPALEGRCQGTQVPAERWNRMRQETVDRFVKDALL